MRESLFKLANWFGITAYLHGKKINQLTVLSLHRISEDEDYFFKPIRPELFKNLLAYVTSKYTIVNFQMLRNRMSFNKPPLMLSFDDGYYDFIEHALPIIRSYGIPVNHNLVNSCLSNGTPIWTQKLNDIFNVLKENQVVDDLLIGHHGRTFRDSSNNWIKYYAYFFRFLLGIRFHHRESIIDELMRKYSVKSRSRMMTWDDVMNIHSDDIEIGSHSYRHDILSTLATEEELQSEMLDSIREIEMTLNVKVNIFAPPNGQCNDRVIAYARKIGIKHVLLVNDQTTSISIHPCCYDLVGRINMINESECEMLLRMELFHSRVRRLI